MPSSTGTSSTSYQDALDKAVASALKKVPGADRSITWSVRSASGSAGGIKPGTKYKVAIDFKVD